MMNAAQERLSGYAASLESPCANCRFEEPGQGTTMCAPCLDAATYSVFAEATVSEQEAA